MVSSQDEKKMANAVGGKTARACDNCIKKRARWYCPSDDAFLCQSCDTSVHSVNPLARRHERVRLKIVSNSSSSSSSTSMMMMMMITPTSSSRQSSTITDHSPSWHKGFTKKARTPRQVGKHASSTTTTNDHVVLHHHHHHLVPEVCSDDNSHESNYYNEDQLVYRVPIFDPLHVSELCSTTTTTTTSNSNIGDHDQSNSTTINYNKDVMMMMMNTYDHDVELDCINNDHGGPSDQLELDEFAADVESLLGKGLEAEESLFDMELGLGLNSLTEATYYNSKIKVEQEQEQDDDHGELMEGYNDDHHHHHHDHHQVNTEIIDLAREETFELNFDYYDNDSPLTCDHQEIENKPQSLLLDQRELIKSSLAIVKKDDSVIPTKKIILSLDYDGVIAAWDEQRSPWTNGERPPELDSKDYSCPADCLGLRIVGPYGEGIMLGHGGEAMADGGREARVTRYREKRRTRLFSKKIRYEVRKLNAEKRPRMKGRFVKRDNLLSPSIPNIIALP